MLDPAAAAVPERLQAALHGKSPADQRTASAMSTASVAIKLA